MLASTQHAPKSYSLSHGAHGREATLLDPELHS
jgi:hypothetical protein